MAATKQNPVQTHIEDEKTIKSILINKLREITPRPAHHLNYLISQISADKLQTKIVYHCALIAWDNRPTHLLCDHGDCSSEPTA